MFFSYHRATGGGLCQQQHSGRAFLPCARWRGRHWAYGRHLLSLVWHHVPRSDCRKLAESGNGIGSHTTNNRWSYSCHLLSFVWHHAKNRLFGDCQKLGKDGNGVDCYYFSTFVWVHVNRRDCSMFIATIIRDHNYRHFIMKNELIWIIFI